LFEEEQQLQRNKTFCGSEISLGKESDEYLYEVKAPKVKEVEEREKNCRKARER
jgi:hypothetical protein